MARLQGKKVVHALRYACQRQTNRWKNFAHQESRKLVNTYQFIARVLQRIDHAI